MKKPVIIGGIALSIVGIVMAVTNPKPEAYHQYISAKLLTEGEKAFCKQTEVCDDKSTSTITATVLQSVKNKIAKPAIEKLVEQGTTSQNLGLFSLYTTKFSDLKTLKTLGVFNQFITYSKE